MAQRTADGSDAGRGRLARSPIERHQPPFRRRLRSGEFGELWPILEDRIGGRPVVAHNASFDMSVLRYELDHMDLWPATARGTPIRCA